MVEVSEIGLEEEKEEIELDLGLSIGGSFRKSEKPKPDSKSNGFDSDLGDHQQQRQQQNQVTEDVQRESMTGMGMDPQSKREIHALRRQEAKRKRQQKRWVRESEPDDPHVSKREKTGQCTIFGSTASFPATQVQQPHRYPPVQYLPFNNGFVFPYTVPCWTTSPEKEMVQPPSTAPAPACRGLRPFSVNGCEPEQNGERDCVNGSSMCSSSLVSEHQTSSHEGGGSSTDSHSHSAHSVAEPTQLNCSNKENNIRSLPEQSASSHPVRSEHRNVEGRNQIVKQSQPKITAQAEPTKLKEEATMNSKAVPIAKPLSNETPSNGLSKETKTDMGKPPKPLSLTSSLPQMPYVSTTGNGPNGKTVNGFLYRYTKSEVSIVCVCHGSTFTPAEFVQHAGGTDITHPLRHITVIPSAFG